jgi:hypothetical protein
MSQKQFGILCYRTSVNLGDQIQTLAAWNLLSSFTGLDASSIFEAPLIDRDTGVVYNCKNKEKKVSCIYNGWFDGEYITHWPPDPKTIDPLLLSFHVNETVKTSDYNILSDFKRPDNHSLLDTNYCDWYQTLQTPVGCRDFWTLINLKKKGVHNCYFAGCLTMTLQNKKPKERREDTICLVDVSDKSILPDEITRNALDLTHVFHSSLELKTTPQDIIEYEWQKLKQAQNLLDIYSTAKLVVTSRLHCVMPCLAFGTPVIFVNKGLEQDVRFLGLDQFLPIWGDSMAKNWKQHVNSSIVSGSTKIKWDDMVQNTKNKVWEWCFA